MIIQQCINTSSLDLYLCLYKVCVTDQSEHQGFKMKSAQILFSGRTVALVNLRMVVMNTVQSVFEESSCRFCTVHFFRGSQN